MRRWTLIVAGALAVAVTAGVVLRQTVLRAAPNAPATAATVAPSGCAPSPLPMSPDIWGIDRPIVDVTGRHLVAYRYGEHAASLPALMWFDRGEPRPLPVGEDFHPFGPGAPLALGGVEFDGAPRLQGHSDGDVVLHAVADALLGAAGLGDLGRLFPADRRTRRGIASAALLSDVVERVTRAGIRPTHVDVTIVAARPRLGPRLDEIRNRIAEQHLGLPRSY